MEEPHKNSAQDPDAEKQPNEDSATPSDTAPEEPPVTIPPVNNPEAIPQVPLENSMEVHHHTHSHGKKNWKSYIWEFLMLFLAVFCGFLAEYQLEHKIERDRAKELARSFYTELKNDSVTAGIKVQNRLKQEAALMYMIRYFQDSNLTSVPKQFAINFEYGISFLSPSQFEPRTIMLDQLRNSGSLRYFKNEEFQRLTGELTVAIKNIYHRQELENDNRQLYINPIVIRHYDYVFDAELKRDGKSIFEGLEEYERSDRFINFNLNNLDQVDRKGIVSVLYFFKENVVSSTRKTHIQKYIEVNTALLKILRSEFDLD
ncbi:MAG TPA: hypothetical protein PLI08_11700 [Bacteroidia bacterium]|jgi:hypothetical protein|nr:hypothetical protein [Bacteroidia bacterium]HRI42042.1 hypothetical protein [Bacteroidia bacterium]HRS38848.1 hypothetical protein [Bacteroidia bacterium]